MTGRIPRARRAVRKTLRAAQKARRFRRKHLKIAKFPGRLALCAPVRLFSSGPAHTGLSGAT
jgi:hypothetical protein